MAIGKQYRLTLVPEKEERSCKGCWYYTPGALPEEPLKCPVGFYDHLSCVGLIDGIWELQSVGYYKKEQ